MPDPRFSAFPPSQTSRRIKAATKVAGPAEGFSAHRPRVGMARDIGAAGAELPELILERGMTGTGWATAIAQAVSDKAQEIPI